MISASTIARWPVILRAVAFILGVVICWLPCAIPFYWLSAQGQLPGGDLVPTALLYVFFLVLLPRWERHIHRIQHPWQHIGLTGVTSVALPLTQGVCIGLASVGILAGLQIGFGWAKVSPAEQSWLSLILAGSLTAIAVGWAEELLFRGWLQRELEQGGSEATALVGTSLIFALAHFIKPLDVILATLPQFFGLLLLGLILGWARRTQVMGRHGELTTSLGLPIGLHSGLVWGYYVLSVGDLLTPTAVVPDWVIGRDGNPLAGMLGVALLAGLALWFRHLAHRKKVS
jgi:membrane protease YdiL (CAAX protease family)